LEKTDRELIFIGYSLGGTFLLKYLSEEKIKKEVMALFIVAANITSDHKGYQLDTFSLDFEKVKKIDVKNIFIFHSEDDDSVPFSDSNVLSGLLPDSKKFGFTDRGHFLQEDFPEIVQKIKELENE
jgi:predicted alpha/beta hydrolase family esterase